MSSVLATSLVLCMLVAVCVGQALLFEPVPEECRKFKFSFYDYSAKFGCPDGTVFSTFNYRCVPESSYLNNQCPTFRTHIDIERVCEECRREGGGVDCIFASTTNCAAYINCSKTIDEDIYDNLDALLEECDYPSLFNGMSRKCDDFVRVKCGQREEPKEPCQYKKNQCGRSSHCKPCQYRFANCANKRDGVQPWEGRPWTPYFADCKEQRTLNSGECPSSRNGSPRIFSVTKNRCDDLAAIPRQYGGFLDDAQ